MFIRRTRGLLIGIITAGALCACSASPGEAGETLRGSEPVVTGDSTKVAPSEAAPSARTEEPRPEVMTCDQYFEGNGTCEEICCRVIPGEPESKWPCTVTHGDCG